MVEFIRDGTFFAVGFEKGYTDQLQCKCLKRVL